MPDVPGLPYRGEGGGSGATVYLSAPNTPPTPHSWTRLFIRGNGIYKDGSHTKGKPRLGAAVGYVSTCTIIYIDTGGTDETHTIMRVESMTIQTALAKYATHEWVGIFADSLYSLHDIRHNYTNPGVLNIITTMRSY
jgi:hypothetical protein